MTRKQIQERPMGRSMRITSHDLMVSPGARQHNQPKRKGNNMEIDKKSPGKPRDDQSVPGQKKIQGRLVHNMRFHRFRILP